MTRLRGLTIRDYGIMVGNVHLNTYLDGALLQTLWVLYCNIRSCFWARHDLKTRRFKENCVYSYLTSLLFYQPSCPDTYNPLSLVPLTTSYVFFQAFLKSLQMLLHGRTILKVAVEMIDHPQQHDPRNLFNETNI